MSLIKELFGLFIRYSGFLYLIIRLFYRDKVGILLYHDPGFDRMDIHLKYLSKYFNFISLANLYDSIQNQDFSDLPSRSLVITLDDGCKDNFILLPLFRKYNVRPTIFICSEIVDTHRHFWWRAWKEIAPEKIVLSGLSNVKNISNCLKLQRLQICGFEQTMEFEERHALNLKEIRDMMEYVDFGSHTCFHPILTQCEDDECCNEITTSRKQIAKITGKKCLDLAYPNGDHANREVDLAKKAGYRSARTTLTGWNSVDTDLMRLKCIGIWDNSSINWLAAQLTGIPGVIKDTLVKLKKYRCD